MAEATSIEELAAKKAKENEGDDEDKNDEEPKSLREETEHGQGEEVHESKTTGEVGGAEDDAGAGAGAGEGKKHRVRWRKGAVSASHALSIARTAIKTNRDGTATGVPPKGENPTK